ncbi:MAG: hypothetical protein ABJ360_18900 [Roseobacter sp.]
MFLRSALIGLTLATTATAALAGPSGQHSAEATYHSGAAASHAGNAVVSGAVTVAAVPIVAVGSALVITGAALDEVGNNALNVGADLSHSIHPAGTKTVIAMPNAAPTLD